eukprot:1064566_1
MSNPESPILDFYPTSFRLDLNGKKFAWQAVALLPFIEEKRLLDTIVPVFDTLSNEQIRMNGVGETYIFTSSEHPMANTLLAMYNNQTEGNVPIDVVESVGLPGGLRRWTGAVLPGETLRAALTGPGSEGWSDATPRVRVLSAIYDLPPYTPHVTRLLTGATEAEPILKRRDHDHCKHGRRFGKPRGGGRGRGRGGRGGRGGGQWEIDRGRNDLRGWRQGDYRANQQPGGANHRSQPFTGQRGGQYGAPQQYGGQFGAQQTYGGQQYANQQYASRQYAYPAYKSAVRKPAVHQPAVRWCTTTTTAAVWSAICPTTGSLSWTWRERRSEQLFVAELWCVCRWE